MLPLVDSLNNLSVWLTINVDIVKPFILAECLNLSVEFEYICQTVKTV